MTQEELIQVGEDCELLLKSEPMNRVINQLVEQYFQAWTNSKPDESKERSVTYYQYRALVDLVNTLKQQVLIKDEIVSQRDISEEEA